MVTFDTVRHVLLDHGGVIVRKESLTMYKDANHNLSAIGLFSQWSAIIGLVFMFIGVSWVANIFDPLLKTVFGAGSGGDYYV